MSPRGRGRWVVGAVLIAAAAIAVGGFIGYSRLASRVAGNQRNVLLITLDTTRADALGCYGNATAKTPRLDELARQGVRFARCATPSPQTLPSHCSILTGLYPRVHGVRRNRTDALAEDALSIAEHLKAAEYATAAAVASVVLDREFGVDQGFDEYRTVHPPGVGGANLAPERRGDAVCDDGLELLRGMQDRPFLLWVHFFDPHYPYESKRHPDVESPAAYADEVTFMDAQVGRLLDELERLGLDDNTIVLAVGDHGEGLGDHGEFQHGYFVYETVMHVPLVMRVPELASAGRDITAQVRTIDIAPTLAALLDVKPLPDAQGVDLTPLLSESAADLELAAYGEAVDTHVIYGMSRLRSLTEGGWKYILAPHAELYDLGSDPGELHNVIAQYPERAAGMRETLETIFIDSTPAYSATPQQPRDDAALHRLAALGYVGGSVARSDAAAEPFAPTGENPHEYVGAISDALRAHRLFLDRQYAQAEVGLRRAIEALPRAPTLRLELAKALTQQGKSLEAIAEYDRLLEAAPEKVETRKLLLMALGRTHQWRRVLVEGARVLESRPEDSGSHALVATAHAALGDVGAAEQRYTIALEHDPQNVAALYGLGNVLMQQQRYAEAADCFRRAVTLNPKFERARAALEAAEQELGG